MAHGGRWGSSGRGPPPPYGGMSPVRDGAAGSASPQLRTGMTGPPPSVYPGGAALGGYFQQQQPLHIAGGRPPPVGGHSPVVAGRQPPHIAPQPHHQQNPYFGQPPATGVGGPPPDGSAIGHRGGVGSLYGGSPRRSTATGGGGYFSGGGGGLDYGGGGDALISNSRGGGWTRSAGGSFSGAANAGGGGRMPVAGGPVLWGEEEMGMRQTMSGGGGVLNQAGPGGNGGAVIPIQRRKNKGGGGLAASNSGGLVEEETDRSRASLFGVKKEEGEFAAFTANSWQEVKDTLIDEMKSAAQPIASWLGLFWGGGNSDQRAGGATASGASLGEGLSFEDDPTASSVVFPRVSAMGYNAGRASLNVLQDWQQYQQSGQQQQPAAPDDGRYTSRSADRAGSMTRVVDEVTGEIHLMPSRPPRHDHQVSGGAGEPLMSTRRRVAPTHRSLMASEVDVYTPRTASRLQRQRSHGFYDQQQQYTDMYGMPIMIGGRQGSNFIDPNSNYLHAALMQQQGGNLFAPPPYHASMQQPGGLQQHARMARGWSVAEQEEASAAHREALQVAVEEYRVMNPYAKYGAAAEEEADELASYSSPMGGRLAPPRQRPRSASLPNFRSFNVNNNIITRLGGGGVGSDEAEENDAVAEISSTVGRSFSLHRLFRPPPVFALLLPRGPVDPMSHHYHPRHHHPQQPPVHSVWPAAAHYGGGPDAAPPLQANGQPPAVGWPPPHQRFSEFQYHQQYPLPPPYQQQPQPATGNYGYPPHHAHFANSPANQPPAGYPQRGLGHPPYGMMHHLPGGGGSGYRSSESMFADPHGGPQMHGVGEYSPSGGQSYGYPPHQQWGRDGPYAVQAPVAGNMYPGTRGGGAGAYEENGAGNVGGSQGGYQQHPGHPGNLPRPMLSPTGGSSRGPPGFRQGGRGSVEGSVENLTAESARFHRPPPHGHYAQPHAHHLHFGPDDASGGVAAGEFQNGPEERRGMPLMPPVYGMGIPPDPNTADNQWQAVPPEQQQNQALPSCGSKSVDAATPPLARGGPPPSSQPSQGEGEGAHSRQRTTAMTAKQGAGESKEGSSPASMAAAGKGSSSSSSNSFGGGGVGKSTAAAGGASPASGGGGEDMPAALKMYSQDELDKIRAFVAKVYKMNPFSGWLEKRNPSGWGYKTRYVTIRQFQLDYSSSPEEPVLGTLRFDASIWTHEAGQDANLFSMKSTSDQRVYQWRIPQGSDHSRQAWMDAIRKRMKACAFIEQLKQAVDCRPKRPAPAVTGRDKVQRPSASSDSPTEATTTTKMSSGGAAGGWSPSVRREDGKSSGRPFGGAASGLSRDASGSSSSLGFSSRRRGAAGLGKGSSSFGGDGGSGVFVLPHSASNDGEVAITATKRIGSAHR